MEPLRSYTDMEVVLNYKPLRSYTDMEVVFQTAPAQIVLTAPADEATGVGPDVLHQWEAFPAAEFYRVRAFEDNAGSPGAQVIDKVVNAIELQELLTESTTYHWNVRVTNRQSPTPPAEITGTTITPSTTTVVEGQTLSLEGTVQGSGDYNQNGTWTRESGNAVPFTADGNSIDIEPVMGDAGDQAVFRFTSADNEVFSEVTITVMESSGEFSNDRAGDEAALVQLAIETNVAGWGEAFGWSPATMSLASPIYGVTVAQVNGELRVVEIDLNDNGLNGVLPTIIGNWAALEYVNIKQNSLSGVIPASISNWVNIEYVLFSGNEAGDLPWDNLNYGFNAGYSNNATNTFNGEFPDVWGSWSNLIVFQLAGSAVTRIYYPSISACQSVQWLITSWSTQLNQVLPEELFFLPNVAKLVVTRSLIQGPLPAQTNLPELRSIYFKGNDNLSGALPNLGLSKKIREIYMHENEFTGAFPSYLFDGTHTDLFGVYLSWNNLTGTLPDFAPSRANRSLRTLVLDGNNLTGTIPESIPSHNQLILLGLGWNGFTGQIPQTGWGNHDRTRYIRFANNNLEGPIPDELPNSPDLQNLYFENNNLSGPVSTNHGKYANTGNYPNFNYMSIGNNNFVTADHEDLKAILGSKLLT